MIKKFVEKWNKYSNNLEEYFRNTKQEEYSNYEEIVKVLFDEVINKGEEDTFDTKEILVMDDGNYHGTQIFILHKDTYQPEIEDYVYTNTYYGSCSGCDTLLSISSYNGGIPDENQIKEYMMLALHLLQRCKYMS